MYDDTHTPPVEEFERTRPPNGFRLPGHTHRVYWNNTVVGGYTTAAALRAMRQSGRFATSAPRRRATTPWRA